MSAVHSAAMKTGKYEKVQNVSGRMMRHYACTDHREYFAELSEAFWSSNKYVCMYVCMYVYGT